MCELLAHHYTEAGLIEQAVAYWHKAAQRAGERSAHMEVLGHLRQGLALLQTLPETSDRVQHEVAMHIALGASLIATKGYGAAEVGETYTDARQRCTYLEDPYQLFPVLRGLWNYYTVRAELQTAHALGQQLLALARHVQDPALFVAAHRAFGTSLFLQGAAAEAHTHLAQGLALYDLQQHRAYALLYGEDAGVVCGSHDAWALWVLGYPAQGLARSHEMVTLARQRAYPFSLGYALFFAAMLHQFRREVPAVQEHAEATISLATDQGFPHWMAVGVLMRGWALAHQGQAQEGIAQLRQGVRAWRATGAELRLPFDLARLAEAYAIMGQSEAGLTAVAEALMFADKTGERWYEPELYRLKGELLLQQSLDNQAEAETCFHHALEIAHNQQAKSFELRTATSLAMLWQQQGKRQEAHDLLAPIYGWFTEGFDTADLKDAKALLDELA